MKKFERMKQSRVDYVLDFISSLDEKFKSQGKNLIIDYYGTRTVVYMDVKVNPRLLAKLNLSSPFDSNVENPWLCTIYYMAELGNYTVLYGNQERELNLKKADVVNIINDLYDIAKEDLGRV